MGSVVREYLELSYMSRFAFTSSFEPKLKSAYLKKLSKLSGNREPRRSKRSAWNSTNMEKILLLTGESLLLTPSSNSDWQKIASCSLMRCWPLIHPDSGQWLNTPPGGLKRALTSSSWGTTWMDLIGRKNHLHQNYHQKLFTLRGINTSRFLKG